MIRVLTVDDKQENLYLLRALLQGHGCVVDEASHGAEAIDKALQAPPDLIISDLLMPVMDGYTSARKIREIRKEVRLIAQTAYSFSGDMEDMAASGFDDFLIKPIYSGQLIEKLSSYYVKL